MATAVTEPYQASLTSLVWNRLHLIDCGELWSKSTENKCTSNDYGSLKCPNGWWGWALVYTIYLHPFLSSTHGKSPGSIDRCHKFCQILTCSRHNDTDEICITWGSLRQQPDPIKQKSMFNCLLGFLLSLNFHLYGCFYTKSMHFTTF